MCQFQKDRDAHARCGFQFFSIQYILCRCRELLTAMLCFTILHTSYGRRRVLLAIWYQFQKDRHEQTRCGFKFLFILHTLCRRRRLLTAVQVITILHTSSGRLRLLKAMQFFTILHTSYGRRRLLVALFCKFEKIIIRKR